MWEQIWLLTIMQAVNALLDQDNIKNSKYVNSAKAVWAQGGITYEMFRDSYNQVRGSNEEQNLVVTNGAVAEDWSNSLARLSGTQADLYVWKFENSKDVGYNYYSLASPSADYLDRVMHVSNYLSYVNNRKYDGYADGLRPLVCLKSNIQLEKHGDAYDIRVI